MNWVTDKRRKYARRQHATYSQFQLWSSSLPSLSSISLVRDASSPAHYFVTIRNSFSGKLGKWGLLNRKIEKNFKQLLEDGKCLWNEKIKILVDSSEWRRRDGIRSTENFLWPINIREKKSLNEIFGCSWKGGRSLVINGLSRSVGEWTFSHKNALSTSSTPLAKKIYYFR